MFVTAGFIIGFDSEKTDVGQFIAEFIELSAIPVAMVGYFMRLPNTQLRVALSRRAVCTQTMTLRPRTGGDQCTTGLTSTLCGPCGMCSEITNAC